MLMMRDYQASIAQRLSRSRRTLAATSPRHFAQVYLAGHCTKPFSPMHDELFTELEALIKQRGGRLAVAAPRGHAKSTIVSMAFVLWCLIYEKERLILLVSATRDQAVLLLRHVKDQLLRNELLLADFPKLCRLDGGPGSGRQPKPWRDNRIKLGNGTMVFAYGAGQSLRGARNDNERPGLIIVDDLEDQEQVNVEDQRIKLQDWFDRTLMHAGHTNTNAIVIGTVLHHDSLLANLVKPNSVKGWKSMIYRAVISFAERTDLWDKWESIYGRTAEHEEKSGPKAAKAFYLANRKDMRAGAKVLWPKWETYYDLMLMKLREGRASFQAEKQNEPLDPELCIFSEARIHYWDDEYQDEQALLAALRPNFRIYGACDPSLGNRTGKGDYSAIAIIARHSKTKVKYVLTVDIARRSPDATIERILQYAKMYSFTRFGVESNHFQSIMFDNLKRRASGMGVRLNLKKIENRTSKVSRIANLEPEVAQGLLRFRKKDHMLLDQLRAFPLGAHDDGPDALEMAVDQASKPSGEVICMQY